MWYPLSEKTKTSAFECSSRLYYMGTFFFFFFLNVVHIITHFDLGTVISFT